jgi:cyclopropane fatty-acyl-phospholipid synthase-like methyltransferase
MSSMRSLSKEFTKEYYIGGKTSNYMDYREKRFEGQRDDILRILDPSKDSTFVDFGCAIGGLMKAFIKAGYENIRGTDISLWAVKYGKETLGLGEKIQFYNLNMLYEPTDYMFAFDVFEHLPDYELDCVLSLMRRGLTGKLMMRVPVSAREGENYVLDVSRNDKTHIQTHSRSWWILKLEEHKFNFIGDISAKHIYSSMGVFAGIFEGGLR